MSSFDPKLQNFTITGSDGVTDIPISMAAIDAQRVRLANICISYGVQLGLCLATLLVVLLLVPAAKLRRQAIHAVHISSLVVAVIRLVLLIQYFPGPLSEYYVSWTRDARALSWPSDYEANTAGNTFNVVQFALIEATLIMQSWNLMRTWSPGAWPRFVKLTSIALAMTTVAVKSAWVTHHTWALRESTLPVSLDAVGQAATVLGAVSIFYFCGIFFLHLMIHLFVTRGVLSRPERGLTSLEILAIGNGTLMVLPSIFAGLDIAAGLSGTRILPFDAGSWVMTLVVIGLPLTGLVARHLGPSAGATTKRASNRFSLFANLPNHDLKHRSSQADDTTLSSPFENSFMVLAEATRASSMRSGREGASPKSSRSRRIEEEEGRDEVVEDIESGIQVRQDVSVLVEAGQAHAGRISTQDRVV